MDIRKWTLVAGALIGLLSLGFFVIISLMNDSFNQSAGGIILLATIFCIGLWWYYITIRDGK